MFNSYIRQGIDKATDLLMVEAKKRTPEDTFELQKWHQKQPIVDSNWLISGWLVNKVSYAKYVEFGVGKSYNYYKDWGRRKWASPFTSWIGARMYSKTQFENEKQVKAILEQYINQGIKNLNRK